MVKFLKKAVIASLCGGFLVSCGDEDLLKFDNIIGVKNWEPTYVAPIAQGDFTIWQLIDQYDENSTIVKDGNDIIIRHLQEDIYSLDVKDFVSMPENIAEFRQNLNIPVSGTLLEDVTLPFDLEPARIKFEDGYITKVIASLNLSYSMPHTSFKYHMVVTFPNILVNGQALEIETDGGENGSLVLNGAVFDMEDFPNQLNCRVVLTVPAGETVTVQSLNVAFGLNDFKFSRVEGIINTKELEIPADKFSMDVDFWNHFDGALKFADPKVELVVRNYGLAVPVAMDMHFVAFGNGKEVALDAGDYRPTFNGWNPEATGITTETQGYNKDNSNIAALLSLPPKDKITYSGQAVINPGGKKVVVLNDGYVNMDALVEIPLHLSASDLIFSDTVDDIKIKDVDKIIKARLTVSGRNEIPLELSSGNLLLLNASMHCIDSVKVNEDGKNNFLDAPEVNAAGEVVKAAESKCQIPLSEENIKNLEYTKYIVIAVKACTSNKGNVPVKIKADARLHLMLQLEVKADLNDL